jgi:hypothetical protein
MLIAKPIPHILKILIPFVFLHLVPAQSLGADDVTSNVKARIIGEWQVGANNFDYRGTPLADLIKIGILGPVWRFKPDNTMDMYLPCDIDGIRKNSVMIQGKYQLLDNGSTIYILSEFLAFPDKPPEMPEIKGALEFGVSESGADTMTIKGSFHHGDFEKNNNGSWHFGRFDKKNAKCE